MATKNKMTKEQREEREGTLTMAMLRALVAMDDAEMVRWGTQVKSLSDGLSATAIKRAQRKAQKLAEDMPPGHFKAMEAMAAFDDLCRLYKISKVDQDVIWGAIAQFCMFQLASRRGTFFEAASDFKLVPPPPSALRIEIVRMQQPDLVTTCDCPNCQRERKAEELN